jgi:hypothetical protein
MRSPFISSENLFLGFKIQAFSKEVLATQTADSGHQFRIAGQKRSFPDLSEI